MESVAILSRLFPVKPPRSRNAVEVAKLSGHKQRRQRDGLRQFSKELRSEDFVGKSKAMNNGQKEAVRAVGGGGNGL